MQDTGAAARPNGYTEDEDGIEVEDFTTLFSSLHKVQARQLQAREGEVGGRTATSVTVELHLPVSAPLLTTGDVFTVTSVGPTSASWVGRKLRIVAPMGKTYLTARRYEVEEIVS